MRIKSTVALPAILMIPLLSVSTYANTRMPAAPAVPLMRTYVSGTGNDSSPCTASQPCATFQAALALTMAGGEIFVLNSANYGPVTINKALTITSEGAVAGVLATSGAAITITAGPNDVVNLRGLGLDGANTGTVGIQFTSGKSLTIQKSFIRNFATYGISFAPNGAGTLFVSDTSVTNNGNSGLFVLGASSGATAVKAAMTRVIASGNGVGILASGTGASLAVSDSVANNNTYGIGANSSIVMVRNSTTSANSVGINADQPGAIVRVSQSTITGNNTGWAATNSGQVQSYGNNNVGGNSNDGTATTTLALQ
jgi:hypothetical protein